MPTGSCCHCELGVTHEYRDDVAFNSTERANESTTKKSPVFNVPTKPSCDGPTCKIGFVTGPRMVHTHGANAFPEFDANTDPPPPEVPITHGAAGGITSPPTAVGIEPDRIVNDDS